MTVSGYPSRPQFALASAEALANGAVGSWLCECAGREWAAVRLTIDQACTVYVVGELAAGAASGYQLYSQTGSKLSIDLTGASDVVFLVPVGALGTIGVSVWNTSGAAAAVTVEVLLR